MKKLFLVLVAVIILIASASAIYAQESDCNQTDILESEIVTPEENSSQDVLSVSYEESLNSQEDYDSTGAYLVLDNDADKENVYQGDYVTWVLEAQNLGPGTAKKVKVHDKLPNGLKYIKHTATKGTFNPKTGIWDIGDLSVEDGIVSLFITTKSITVGEKVNEAYITSDTFNSNKETFEEEEIDVFARDNPQEHAFEKHASAKMHETGNPIILILASLFVLFIPIMKKY